MRIVLTGGGTGGHVVPNIAVIEELKRRGGVEILYIGSENGPEKKMIEKLGVEFRAIPCGKLRRYFSWENFMDIFRVVRGVSAAKKILREWKPDKVFSKGGYVSLPVTVAAWQLKTPYILHESDVSPGIANKVAARGASKICVSFEESVELMKKWSHKVVMTGNPVREEMLSGDADAGLHFTKLDNYRPVVLVMGGSQGAEQINKLVREGLDELLKHYQIVHLTGRGNIDIGVHRDGYVQYEFLGKELADVYAMSELVVSRGGANALAEIALLKKRAVIIPLSTDGSRGDQVENAKAMVKKFGWSMLSGNVNVDDFVDVIEMAFRNELSDAKIENGTKKIVDLIME